MSDIFAARSQVETSLLIGGSVAVLQAMSGDVLARVTARNQPTTLAGMEGDFQTRRGAPLRIGGLPDVQTKKYNVGRMAGMFHVGLIPWGWGLSQSLPFSCRET